MEEFGSRGRGNGKGEGPLPPGEGGRAKREPDRAKPQERPGEGSRDDISAYEPSPGASARWLSRPPSPAGRGLEG